MQRRAIQVTSVINNAGFGAWGRFHNDDPERLGRMLAVDVIAVADVSRRVTGGRSRGT